MKRALAFIGIVLATPALGDLSMEFREGAPKDRFALTNTGTCPTGPLTVTLDLTGSNGGLIFDVTGEGAGVSVFQPFETVSGAAVLSSKPEVRDGDRVIVLHLKGLDAGQDVAFTIDVDDTGPASPTIVSGSEIRGAVFRVSAAGNAYSATFNTDARAVVPFQTCLS